MDYEAIIDALRRSRSDVAGGGGSLKKGYAMGGRVSSEIPLSDTDALRLALSGNSVNTAGYRKREMTGAEAEYRQGDQSFGVEWKRKNPGGFFQGQAMPGNGNELWLKYSKNF